MKPTDIDFDLGDPGDMTIQETGAIAALVAAATAKQGANGEPIRLSPQEFTWVSVLARHYRKHFGQRLDVEQFVAKDSYARVVLHESLNSGNAALSALAKQFLDRNGQPSFQVNRAGSAA